MATIGIFAAPSSLSVALYYVTMKQTKILCRQLNCSHPWGWLEHLIENVGKLSVKNFVCFMQIATENDVTSLCNQIRSISVLTFEHLPPAPWGPCSGYLLAYISYISSLRDYFMLTFKCMHVALSEHLLHPCWCPVLAIGLHEHNMLNFWPIILSNS